jgi:hydrogenase-4 component B
MTPVMAALCSVPAFLGVPLLAAAAMGWSAATRVIYGACVVICIVVLVVALTQLLSPGSTASSLRLPLGLPWIGAHFRVDALAAFFLAAFSPSAMAHTKKRRAGCCRSMRRFSPA